MHTINIKKGLDLPLPGKPDQTIIDPFSPSKVALVGFDYPGLKPDLQIQVGDRVKRGQVLFRHKTNPRIAFTSPGSGIVEAINRGQKRMLESIVIRLEGDDEVVFNPIEERQLAEAPAEKIKSMLLDSGLWTSIRCRPFGKVANPDLNAASIFVTAMDTQPHAPDMQVIYAAKKAYFETGLTVVSRLTQGKIFLGKSPELSIPTPASDRIEVVNFSGPHPAGNVGTHIHFLDPVNIKKSVFYLSFQDMLAIGQFILTGKIPLDRIVAFSGPSVAKPCLLRTRIGAALDELKSRINQQGEHRLISGSVLTGRQAAGTLAFLGRFHQQISVIPEDRERQFFGWLSPGFHLFSLKKLFMANFIKPKKYRFTTSLHGAQRAIVPIGSYEKVMPLDIIATALLRALCAHDLEEAENLGCLELEEEDLALCSFVCPGKNDFGAILRENLNKIEKEHL